VNMCVWIFHRIHLALWLKGSYCTLHMWNKSGIELLSCSIPNSRILDT
jgi:hypothetical protein